MQISDINASSNLGFKQFQKTVQYKREEKILILLFLQVLIKSIVEVRKKYMETYFLKCE